MTLRTDRTDGGPAYPNSVQPDFKYEDPGMSLRDWFAGQVVATISDNPRCDSYRTAAVEAYRFADEMLKAREDVQ